MSQAVPSAAIAERIQKWEKEKRRILGPAATREQVAALLPQKGTYAAARLTFLEDLVSLMQRDGGQQQQQHSTIAQQLKQSQQHVAQLQATVHLHGLTDQGAANVTDHGEFLASQAREHAAGVGQLRLSHAQATDAAERLHRQLQDSQREKEDAVAHTTRTFEAVARRTAARHEEQLRQLHRDVDRHRTKAEELQSILDQREDLDSADKVAAHAAVSDALRAAEASTDVLRLELQEARAARQRAEATVQSTKQTLHAAGDATGQLMAVAAQLLQATHVTKRRHKAAVEQLLAAAEGLDPHELPQGPNADADGDADDGAFAADLLALTRSTDTGTATGANASSTMPSGTGIGEGSSSAIGGGTSPAEAVKAQAVRLLRDLGEHQSELAMVVEVAAEAGHRRDQAKLRQVRDSHAFAELLTARVQELEQQIAEQHDGMLRERDRAANERDHALVQLRAHDGRRARLVRHVEVQTAIQ